MTRVNKAVKQLVSLTRNIMCVHLGEDYTFNIWSGWLTLIVDKTCGHKDRDDPDTTMRHL